MLCAGEDREGALWVGTLAGGLNRLQPKRVVTYNTRDGLCHDFVWSICEAGDGGLWIATERGASRFKDGQFNSVTLQDRAFRTSLRSVLEDRSGNLWLGTVQGGVWRVREGQYSHYYSTPEELPSYQCYALYEDRQGHIWIGTRGGLTRFREGTFTTSTTTNGLTSNNVRAIRQDRDGNLWIGTVGGGLNRFADGQFTALTTRDGLASDNAWFIHEDSEGALWIGTHKSLSRLSLTPLRAPSPPPGERDGVRGPRSGPQ